MLFSGEITIPAGTSLVSPATQSIPLIKGLIHQIDVFFPPGNHALAYITFAKATHQIWPTNTEGFIKGNNTLLTGSVFHFLAEAPFEIEVRGFSPTAVYDHIVYFYIWLKLPWQMHPFSDELYNMVLQDTMPKVE